MVTSTTTFTVEAFDPHTASGDDFVAVHRLWVTMTNELYPESPTPTLPETTSDLKRVMSYAPRPRWLARDSSTGAAIGMAEVELSTIDANRHLAWFDVAVDAGFRHRGVGKALLGEVCRAAAADGRTLLMTEVIEDGPGVPFATSAGGRVGLRERKSRLATSRIDRVQMAEWVSRAADRATGYELVRWDGPCPPGLLEEYARVYELGNTAPRDTLDMEDEPETPERVVERQTKRADDGYTWWTLAVRHTASGALAGFTELHFNPHAPQGCEQGWTAVDPTHRNLGLGRWLKAKLALRLLDEKPGVEWVDTWNAYSNDPMLSINIAMGYEVIRAIGAWQFPIDKITEFATGVSK